MTARRPDFSLEKEKVQVSVWEDIEHPDGIRWKLIVRDLTDRKTTRTVIMLMDTVDSKTYQISILAELMAKARDWIAARRKYWVDRATELAVRLEKERVLRERRELNRIKKLRSKMMGYKF